MSDDLISIQNLIYEIRGQKVMLDKDLATLYEVKTKSLNQAVKRNIMRFPVNFMFQLEKEEWKTLRSQNVTFKNDRRKFLPYAFTEQGVAMLSSVLHSERAIQINIQIMNTFVAMRKLAIDNKEIARQLSELEKYFIQHCKDNKEDLKKIYSAIELLMDRTRPSKIGFDIK
ncbi:ORF6N domain-containing protein [bacterium]|nr:ORF6N domain-containing protein [bacterium]